MCKRTRRLINGSNPHETTFENIRLPCHLRIRFEILYPCKALFIRLQPCRRTNGPGAITPCASELINTSSPRIPRNWVPEPEFCRQSVHEKQKLSSK